MRPTILRSINLKIFQTFCYIAKVKIDPFILFLLPPPFFSLKSENELGPHGSCENFHGTTLSPS